MSSSQSNIAPFNGIISADNISEQDKEEWLSIGYDAIARGYVCALLMAGGQGTRLGTEDPKGMYDLNLLSKKTLFQLQAERLIRLKEIVKEKTGINNVSIPWYIMTSFATETKTKEYFKKHNYFNINENDIYFFNQDLFPCISLDGKILMKSKSEIAVSPNGNGGLWSALNNGVLEDMKKRNIKWICSYPVDNILVKICDPLFIGFCIKNNSEIGCKVVSKLYPEERVGVLSLKDGKPSVLEYTEITEERSRLKDPKTGKLIYNYAHTVLNNFSIDFVERVISNPSNLSKLPHHFAKKKINYIDTNTDTTVCSYGYKFELFVFDIFEYAKPDRVHALEINREDEFSPLKNSESEPNDNPRTCRINLSNLHKKYFYKAGGNFSNDKEENLFEISPLISYSGENLENRVKGKVFKLPCVLE